MAASKSTSRKFRIGIVGGGVMGLSIAYNLARRGVRDVVIFEKGYLNSGASGRCGGGIRQQWSSEDNIRLMKQSVAIFKNFTTEMGINVWFRQGGYLMLVRTAEELAALEKSVALQRESGVPTRLLTPAEALKIVPHLNTEGIAGASFNPTDGVIFPWPILWGYADACRKMGVVIRTFTEVLGFKVKGRRIVKVQTASGDVEVDQVINAGGAWSPRVARLVDVDLPNQPYRHEILVTEPLRPFINPMVVLLGEGLYFSQSMRGEIVGGIGDKEESPSMDLSSSFRFLQLFSRFAVPLLPRLAGVKVMRQWAGFYDVTPDAGPILGDVDELDNFFQCNGFMGHGFMMSPIISSLVADRIVDEDDSPIFSRYPPKRFKDGTAKKEGMIIG